MGMDLPNSSGKALWDYGRRKVREPDVEVLEGVVGAFNDPARVLKWDFPCTARELISSSVLQARPAMRVRRGKGS